MTKLELKKRKYKRPEMKVFPIRVQGALLDSSYPDRMKIIILDD
ncbi:hypothetical protein [Fibrobacter sp. UWB11]|nr:hypothetical protein [Fibrobacter sp. UWB11]SIO37511.1 hypothetical protein SAMN05720758_2484 [Fibrobacter sp. UWB11]